MLNDKNITGLLAFFFVVLSLGFLFHQSPTFAGSPLGHLIGILGTVIMIMALIYPFRKRVLKKKGKKNPLNPHIYYGLIGPSLVVFHSAHKFNSLIGLLCLSSLLLVVISGIVGKILFRKVNRTLKGQESDLQFLKNVFLQQKAGAEKCRQFLEQDNENEIGSANSRDITNNGQQTCEVILNMAYSIAEMEHSVLVFSKTKKLFKRWIGIHYTLTFFLFSMVLVHVLTSFYYGIRWLS
jgi:hypothetical protein